MMLLAIISFTDIDDENAMLWRDFIGWKARYVDVDYFLLLHFPIENAL